MALADALAARARAGGDPPRPEAPQRARAGRGAAAAGATCVAKLTDFGGALLAGEEGLTRTGDVLGTLAYMAPEQIDGVTRWTRSADLYSLALVLYEALSRRQPRARPHARRHRAAHRSARCRRSSATAATCRATSPARSTARSTPTPPRVGRSPSCARRSPTPSARSATLAAAAPRARSPSSATTPASRPGGAGPVPTLPPRHAARHGEGPPPETALLNTAPEEA